MGGNLKDFGRTRFSVVGVDPAQSVTAACFPKADTMNRQLRVSPGRRRYRRDSIPRAARSDSRQAICSHFAP